MAQAGQLASRTTMSAPGTGRLKEEGKEQPRPESSFIAAGLEPPSARQEEDDEDEGAEGGDHQEAGGGDGQDGEDDDSSEKLEDNEWGYTAKQMRDLQEAFNVFDTNREDTINPYKLFNVMRSLGLNPTEAEVQDLINAVDEDGNGTIEFEEFCEMMQRKLNQPDREDELKEAFRVFDHDEDGSVSLDDMSSLFDALGMSFTTDEMKEMLLCADSTGQMRVGFEDFVKIAKSEPIDLN